MTANVIRTTLGRGPKIAERVARDVVQDVLRRHLKPGDRLESEAAMVAHYGVGRASIREALRILEVHGLITIKTGPGGGPVVGGVHAGSFGRMSTLYFQMAGATVGELVLARVNIEPVLAGLAASHAVTSPRLSLLDDAIRAGDELDAGSDHYAAVTSQFHSAVAELSGNRVLSLYGESLRELFAERVSRAVLETEHRSHAISDHRKIGQAILAGNAKLAERRMRSHMDTVSESIYRRYPTLGEEIIDWE